MNTFQILGIGFCTLFAVLVILGLTRRRLSPGSGLSWLVLWVVAGIAIARPGLTVIVASALGIERGADLVFYLAILGMFVGFFFVFVRIRRLEENLTTVVRGIALDRAAGTGEPEQAGADSPRLDG